MSEPVSRREFLASGGGGLTILVAGCSSQSTETPFRLTVFNSTDTAHHVEVEVRQDQTVLATQTAAVSAETQGEAGKIETTIESLAYDDGTELAVQATLDDATTSSESVTLDCSAENPGENIILRITSEDAIRIDSSCF